VFGPKPVKIKRSTKNKFIFKVHIFSYVNNVSGTQFIKEYSRYRV
jgi:hypothetical protein